MSSLDKNLKKSSDAHAGLNQRGPSLNLANEQPNHRFYKNFEQKLQDVVSPVIDNMDNLSDGQGCDKLDLDLDHQVPKQKNIKKPTKQTKIFSNLQNVLADYAVVAKGSVLKLIYANFKYQFIWGIATIGNILLPKSLKTPQDQESIYLNKQQYYFYNLLYILLKLNVISLDKDICAISDLLKNLDLVEDDKLKTKIDILNQYLAIQINGQSHDLKYYHLKAIKKAYIKWAYSLQDLGLEPKSYIMRYYSSKKHFNRYKKPKHKDYELYDLKFYNEQKHGFDVPTPKKISYWARLLKAQGYLTIFFTGIAAGLIPAVLAAGTGGPLLGCILLIGFPSIIINIVLYKKYVIEFVKDIINDRLLKDANGKYIWSSIPLFVISVCGGITYSAMAFSASLIALKALGIFIIPAMIAFPHVLLALAITGAVILAAYTLISHTALFFSSMIDVIRSGIVKEFKQYINKHFISIFNQDCSLIYKITIIVLKVILLLSLLAAAFYLTILETALLYTMALAIMPVAPLALGLVLIAAPANLLFTFKVYNFILNQIVKLPANIKYLYHNYTKIINNPILLYEAVKYIASLSILLILNFIYAKGSAKGLVEEMKLSSSRTILNPFAINPNSIGVRVVSQALETADASGAISDGIKDTLKPTKIRLSPEKTKITYVKKPVVQTHEPEVVVVNTRNKPIVKSAKSAHMKAKYMPELPVLRAEVQEPEQKIVVPAPRKTPIIHAAHNAQKQVNYIQPELNTKPDSELAEKIMVRDGLDFGSTTPEGNCYPLALDLYYNSVDGPAELTDLFNSLPSP